MGLSTSKESRTDSLKQIASVVAEQKRTIQRFCDSELAVVDQPELATFILENTMNLSYFHHEDLSSTLSVNEFFRRVCNFNHQASVPKQNCF
ncbi:uncharacterized protein LOC143257097 isoform X2 [Tachypleus tridentatus]|uniref:uncharacterized protein LOC143257097 isoform X2 n=1 Tax=Tachypleus tridentatus TaxID=6853 RepID=UPI003FD3B1AC